MTNSKSDEEDILIERCLCDPNADHYTILNSETLEFESWVYIDDYFARRLEIVKNIIERLNNGS